MQTLLDFKIIIIKYLYLFFIGSAIGSFYKTIYDRILYYFYSPKRKEFTLKQKYKELFFKPSFCYNCKNKISYKYLIPLLGFFLTKRRCNYCKTTLNYDLLLWEVLGGILICYFFYFYEFIAFLYVLIVFHFLIVAFIDRKKYYIDYENLFFLYLWGIILFFFNNDFSNSSYLIIKVSIFFIFFLVLFLLGKGKKLGFGDILLLLSISIVFEIPEILIIINLGAMGSIIFILFYKRNKYAYAPLGFFLSFASIGILLIKPLDLLNFF